VNRGDPVVEDETSGLDAGALFRSVNERIRELGVPAPEVVYDFVCECLDPRCFAPLALSAGEFDAVCATPDTYIVHPGHQDGDTDEVVGRSDRYTLVIRAAEPAAGLRP
jgi:hypothetical protein